MSEENKICKTCEHWKINPHHIKYPNEERKEICNIDKSYYCNGDNCYYYTKKK